MERTDISIDLPIKIAGDINIKDFKAGLDKILGTLAFNKISYIFDKYYEIRKEIKTKEIKKLSNNKVENEKYQEMLLNLLKYSRLLEKYFSKSFEGSNSIKKCTFEWTDTLKAKQKSISHIRYDFICTLYNLAIVIYHQALSLDTENASKKMSDTVWIISYLRRLSDSLSVQKKPFDLSPDFLDFFFNYFSALKMIIDTELYELKSDKSHEIKVSSEIHLKIACEYNKIASYLKSGIKSLNSVEIDDTYKSITKKVEWLKYYYESYAMHEFALWNSEQNPSTDDLSEIPLYTADKYEEKAIDMLQSMYENFKNTALQAREKKRAALETKIKLSWETIKHTLNTQYPDQNGKSYLSASIPEINPVFGVEEPLDLSISPELEEKFMEIISPDFNTLKKALEDKIENEKLKMVIEINKFSAKKLQVYDDRVYYFLQDKQNSEKDTKNEHKLPKDLDQNIKVIENLGGKKHLSLSIYHNKEKIYLLKEQLVKLIFLFGEINTFEEKCKTAKVEYESKIKTFEDIIKKYQVDIQQVEEQEANNLQVFLKANDFISLTNDDERAKYLNLKFEDYMNEDFNFLLRKDLQKQDRMLHDESEISFEIRIKEKILSKCQKFFKTFDVHKLEVIASKKNKIEEKILELDELVQPLIKDLADNERSEINNLYDILENIKKLASQFMKEKTDQIAQAKNKIETTNVILKNLITIFDLMEENRNTLYKINEWISDLEEEMNIHLYDLYKKELNHKSGTFFKAGQFAMGSSCIGRTIVQEGERDGMINSIYRSVMVQSNIKIQEETNSMVQSILIEL